MTETLTAEQILQQSDLKYKRVFAKRWNGDVLVHELPNRDRRTLQRFLRMVFTHDKQPPEDPAVFAVAKSLRSQPNGPLLFSVEQMQQLREKSGDQIEELGEVVIELSGLREVDKYRSVFEQTRKLIEQGKPLASDGEELAPDDEGMTQPATLSVDANAAQKVLERVKGLLEETEADNDPTEKDEEGNLS